ncbi:CheR family methyltransferase [Gluconobacter thailandicus]|uniref:CheR family methyltransferase n=1 Tax=Gluconobacter thailandicus TaxID=257438 RepID=UPI00034AB6B0|nr:CheR family methyltransferase [Gluconobacter thailandicus]KXV53874.1 chemotaxis protein CheR [Gluconobacter thailandicus]GBR57689.1 chemotaxis protein CheR [Gluconobacter thailandicus F149-1 = NBRC 100600]
MLSLSNKDEKISRRSLRIISQIAYDVSGILLNDKKEDLVFSRLNKRLRENKISNFEEYCDIIQSDAVERSQMVAALTTNVTAFYREKHHFNYLSNIIRNGFINKIKNGEELRIWSAACSSGEEAYSAAMTASEILADLSTAKMKILGTDIDTNMLERSRIGFYDLEEKKSIPLEIFNKFCLEKGKEFTFKKEILETVRFKSLNLITEWPFESKFHAIFCRNVAIYFDKPTREKLWSRLAERLHVGGEIYIGHSERISNPDLLGLRPVGLNSYKRVK